MPLVQTRGAASAQGFGEFAQAGAVNYIEDVFSCFLYTGNGSTQTINNGIDLAGEGGLVWLKQRTGANGHNLYDTARGATQKLATNETNESNTVASGLTSFSASGFSLGSFVETNLNTSSFVSWTFRKQPKFFDVVTYSGNNAAQNIAHSLGSAPGCIIVKDISAATNWAVFHRSLSNAQWIKLNGTDAADPATNIFWNLTDPTSTNFSVGTALSVTGRTYVAYLFAHDAGGFGLTGTDNVISCGSLTSTSGVVTATLGYEPQWIMMKNTTSADSWYMYDTMRGMSLTNDVFLQANNANAEGSFGASYVKPIATGFTWDSTAFGGAGDNYIYIAIRRGPMKVPTLGTSVFSPVARAGTSATATVTTGFPVDMTIIQDRTQNSFAAPFDRLRGATKRLFTPFTSAEASEATTLTSFAVQNGFTLGTDLSAGFVNTTGDNYINWSFRRAPSFFDEVCYTGTGANGQIINHNLSAIPEMVIIKGRDSNSDWFVYQAGLSSGNSIYLNRNYAQSNDGGPAFSLSTTALTISRTYVSNINSSGINYVAYLFATCAGVSKVGSYTGNGSSQTINCGFTGGARFVMVKATSTTGNWIVADSARGIVAGNDPALYLNSTAAEVTGLDWIDADNSGFVVNETATIAANTNDVSYIFLAVA